MRPTNFLKKHMELLDEVSEIGKTVSQRGMAKRTNVQRQNAIHAAVVGIATKTATDWLKAKTLQRKPSQGIRKLQGSNPHSEHEQSRLVVNKEECRALANPEEAGAKKPSEDVESRPIPEIG